MKAVSCDSFQFNGQTVNVRVYSAAQPEADVRFNTLHAACGSRVTQRYVCPACAVTVPSDEQVKGYEYTKGEYVVVSDDEVNACAHHTRGIEIVAFVTPSAVSPLYDSKAYYVGPDTGCEQRFASFVTAMRDTGRDAVAWWSARGKRHPVRFMPWGQVAVMHQLYFADAVREASELGVEQVRLTAAERKQAAQYVMEMSSDTFKMNQFTDDVRGRIVGMLADKVSTVVPARKLTTRSA